MRRASKKIKFRVTFLSIALIISGVFLLSSCFSYLTRIYNTKEEIEALELAYEDKLEEEEELKKEINKLKDPEYMARYTREKYLYSKKGEIIIKIED